VYENSFWARLIDLDGVEEDAEAEFYFSAVKKEDWDLICEGAVFNWHIISRDYAGDQWNTAESVIEFKDLGVWTEEELLEAKQKAKEMCDFFTDDKK
jgi:hypothetical protein